MFLCLQMERIGEVLWYLRNRSIYGDLIGGLWKWKNSYKLKQKEFDSLREVKSSAFSLSSCCSYIDVHSVSSSYSKITKFDSTSPTTGHNWIKTCFCACISMCKLPDKGQIPSLHACSSNMKIWCQSDVEDRKIKTKLFISHTLPSSWMICLTRDTVYSPSSCIHADGS